MGYPKIALQWLDRDDQWQQLCRIKYLDVPTEYHIPFASAFDDILSFTDPTQWTFQNTGDNADVVNCFLTGTRIAMPDGERVVEELQIGDLIQTLAGDVIAVKWVGRQTFRNTIINLPLCSDRAPVCVSKGALGNGLPKGDLYVTADHGLMIEDLLVNAGAFVNGTTIRRMGIADMPAEFTVFHIETSGHEVILANGAPTESFIDYIGRKSFDNYADYVALYGDEPVIAELPMPRISSRRQLPADLRARFGIGSFGEDVTEQTLDFLAARRSA